MNLMRHTSIGGVCILAISIGACSPSECWSPNQSSTNTINISAEAVHPESIELTIDNTEKNSKRCIVNLPTATIFKSTTKGAQKLILAHPVQIIVPPYPDAQIQRMTVKTYCLNRFLVSPSVASPFKYNIYEGGKESDVIRKLVSCLDAKGIGERLAKQVVWMVSETFFNMTIKDVIKRYEEEQEAQLILEAKKKLEDQGLLLLKAKYPGASDQLINDVFKEFRNKSESELRRHARDIALEEVRELVKTRSILEDCGYTTSNSPFFRDSDKRKDL